MTRSRNLYFALFWASHVPFSSRWDFGPISCRPTFTKNHFLPSRHFAHFPYGPLSLYPPPWCLNFAPEMVTDQSESIISGTLQIPRINDQVNLKPWLRRRLVTRPSGKAITFIQRTKHPTLKSSHFSDISCPNRASNFWGFCSV